MDDPVAEITQVVQTLCTSSPNKQKVAINTYFTPTASFTHPFCRTGSFENSRFLIQQVFRWYKILSPHVTIAVDSVAFDESNLLLYVSIHQTFKLQVVPFYRAPVRLVTVLKLTQDPYPHKHDSHATQSSSTTPTLKGKKTYASVTATDPDPNVSSVIVRKGDASNGKSKKKYYIQHQEDCYQTTDWIKFLVPYGIGVTVIMAWQFWATILCVIGAFVFHPITMLEEMDVIGDNNDKKTIREST